MILCAYLGINQTGKILFWIKNFMEHIIPTTAFLSRGAETSLTLIRSSYFCKRDGVQMHVAHWKAEFLVSLKRISKLLGHWPK